MERIRQAMVLSKDMQPFIMSEDSSSLTTVGAISGKIQEYQPDAVFVDGIYLMDDENGEWQVDDLPVKSHGKQAAMYLDIATTRRFETHVGRIKCNDS